MSLIENIKNISPKDRLNILRIASLIIFTAVIIILSWNCDDAYHSFTMAKNLVEGNGFVYNIGERVSAATSPLFTLIIAGVYFITRNMFLSGIITCVVFSSLAFYILVFKICKSEITVILSAVTLICSAAFISFTTSGLENSLLFLLAAVYLWIFLENKKYSKKQLFVLALMEGLIAATRIDAGMIFAIPSVYAFVFCRGFDDESKKNCDGNIIKTQIIPLLKTMPIAIAGLLPFIMWELFSLIYYGFLSPNTAFVKLNTGFPISDYLIRGAAYFVSSGIFDIICVLMPAAFVIYCFAKKDVNISHKLIAFGILLYLLYIIYIGGDFMAGRFFTLPLFIAVIGFVNLIEINENKPSFIGGGNYQQFFA